MAKIHITLVGAQPVPVYYGIVWSQCDTAILLHSEKTENVANRIEREISCPIVLKECLDEVDISKIKNKAEELKEKYKDDEISVNVSSGLKTWSHFFGVCFGSLPNAQVIYIDQNNNIFNFSDLTKSSLNQEHELGIDKYLSLYDNKIDSFRDFKDYTEEDDDAVREIQSLRKFDHTLFNALFALLDKNRQSNLKNQKSGEFSLKDDAKYKYNPSFVNWDKTGENNIVSGTLYNRNGGTKTFEISSPHAIELAFNSGWFEYTIAKLMSKLKDVEEIRMNCNFPFNEKASKNEVDVLLKVKNKLLFVECKTQITHTTDIDKFSSVVRTYGGTGAKSIFITDEPMSDNAKAKCKENRILRLSLKDENRKLISHKTIIETIENELAKINER